MLIFSLDIIYALSYVFVVCGHVMHHLRVTCVRYLVSHFSVRCSNPCVLYGGKMGYPSIEETEKLESNIGSKSQLIGEHIYV